MIYPVEITASAATYISDAIKRDGKKNVLLELVDDPCNGYEYRWTMTNDENGDIAIRLNHENVLYLKQSTANMMYASAIVMEKDSLTIMNPNLKGSCGCKLCVNL
jgi:Fe-S cluster assembly iron-binding protein IscA